MNALQSRHGFRQAPYSCADHTLVARDDVDDVQFGAEGLGHPQRIAAARPDLATDGVGVTLHAETGAEVETLDVDSLVGNQPGSEHRVQSPGDERYGFALTGQYRQGAEITKGSG